MTIACTDTRFRPARVSDGFSMLANDFSRAVADARLTGFENLLIERGRAASWSLAILESPKDLKERPEPIAFRLNLTEIADGSHCRRGSLIEAHKSLVASRIFVPSPDCPGLFLINKDYRLWINPKDGTPIFTEGHVDKVSAAKKSPERESVASWATLDPRTDAERRTAAQKTGRADDEKPGAHPESGRAVSGKRARDDQKAGAHSTENRARTDGKAGAQLQESGRAHDAPYKESPASEEFNSDPQKNSPPPPKGGETNPEGGEAPVWSYPEEEGDIKEALALCDAPPLADFIQVRRAVERRDGYHPGWVYRQACLDMAKAKAKDIQHPRGFFKSKVEAVVLDHGSTRPKFPPPKPKLPFDEETRSGVNRWRSIEDYMAYDLACQYPFQALYSREEVIQQFRKRKAIFAAKAAERAREEEELREMIAAREAQTLAVAS